MKMYFYILFIWNLKRAGRKSEGRRESEERRENMDERLRFPSQVAAVDWMAPVEARSLELLPDHRCGFRGPGTWAFCCCFPRCLSRELHQKWSRRCWTSAHMGCCCARLRIYLLGQKSTSNFIILSYAFP